MKLKFKEKKIKNKRVKTKWENCLKLSEVGTNGSITNKNVPVLYKSKTFWI